MTTHIGAGGATSFGRLAVDDILVAVGEAAYVWDVPSDHLRWIGDPHGLLELPAATRLDSETAFAALFDPEALTTRREAVFGSASADSGEGVPFEVDYPLLRGGRAQRLWIQDRGRWRAGADGRPAEVVGVIRRLGAHHERAEQAASLARFDPLTGLLARPRLMEIAASALAAGARMQTSTSFVLASVVNLGGVNDAYGFDVGDQVLVAVARRLRGAMRGGDSLGRFSTSTFGLVLQECDAADLQVVGRRLIAAVHDEPIDTGAGAIAVRVAIGGVVAPRHARDGAEFIARARTALARASGTATGFQIYAPDPEREAARRADLRLADELIAAMSSRRVALAYQPVFRAGARDPVWSEALLRITTESGEVVSGGAYVRAAEELKIVHMLDHRVLDLAVRRLAENPQIHLAVNISASTTNDESWLEALTSWFTLRPDMASRLMVEITETAAIADLAVTGRFVAQLRAFGVRVAIDDFGTGHTSFKALRELGVDLVKIDGSFVRDLGTSADSAAFVRALLALARELGLETVAEQVETEEVAELLTAWGATYLQGDLLARPALEPPAGGPDVA
ncbi:GGDEF and EAL domain-containing protein [Methylopila sp. 73B]|uniref:GGDEF and EAL domain-containing protein n=1 Tax=Methylopila sp. 73B TaxID=1120792 RepID=UPI0003680590|nr:GGDEF and EAL domain-containing protein [Methylopila sp. 73B]